MKNSDDDLVDPLDTILAEELPPAMPPSPGTQFSPAPIQPEPIPEATPENMICLRDCRHYVELITNFQAGNAKGTLQHVPRQTNRFCKVIEGSDIDLTDELVSVCNQWDPIDPTFVFERNLRRKRYEEKK